ncbi:MAG: ABC transporter ATP-binding protein [Acidimicrobiales bacterium]
MTDALCAKGISVSFGAVRALRDVDLAVGEGKLVGLIGPNGAGKTTFIDAVTGFVPASGTVELRGTQLAGLAPHKRARFGLVRTWQTIELFDDLSVRENLAVSARRPSLATAFQEIVFGKVPRSVGLAEEALSLLDLGDIAETMPQELPQGRRKLVGIARALAAKPSLLLLDEPAAGLDTSESEDLGRRLRHVVDAGLSALLIDHDMGLVLGICDEIYVLDFGRIIAKGTPEEVRTNPDVLAAYLGTGGKDTSATAPQLMSPADEVSGTEEVAR